MLDFIARNKISVILILASIIILSLSFYNSNRGDLNDKFFDGLDRKDKAINQEHFDKYFRFNASTEKTDGILLFVVGDEFCATCINEIIEYINATTQSLKSPLNPYNIKRYAFVIVNNLEDYQQVNKFINFPFDSELVKKESELAKILFNWSKDIVGVNQLLLIDTKRKMLTVRVGIFNRSTPPHQKRNLVQEVLFELE